MWIWFAIYVLCIISVIFIEKKNPTEALFWVVVFLFLPYVGVLLYLILGDTVGIKLTKQLRTYRLTQGFRKEVLAEMEGFGIEGTKGAVSLDMSTTDQRVATFQKNFNKGTLACLDDYEILPTGKAHYERLFADVAEAKHTIFVEFYTLHPDGVGEAFVAQLTKKAKEGVKVYLMIDAIANITTSNKLFQELRANGGVVKRIKPYLTHFRSHRKIVVIDHAIGYIGGMNIGKQYVGYHKVKTPWRDTQIRFTGSAVCQLARLYLEDLLCCLSKKDLLRLPKEIFLAPKEMVYRNESVCQLVMGGVDGDEETIKLTYLSMISAAKERIQIQSPYFIPDGSILDALRVAVASGVKVEIMVPKVKASFFLDPVTRYYTGQLLKLGAVVYRYHGYIHAKTLVIDDEICCIGSVNMDVRSLQVDDEICGIFYGNDLVADHQALFAKDVEDCTPYTLGEFRERPFGQKVAERVYLMFAPLM